MKNLIFTLILFGVFVLSVHGEKFSSIVKLETLIENEQEIVAELKIFANDFKNSLAYLERKLISWSKENSIATQNVEKYITNPLNAFLTIKRTSSDLKQIIQRFSDQLEKLKENFKEDLKDSGLELAGATAGLLRLQKAYKLRSSDFAQGIIDGKKTIKSFSPDELYVLGIESKKLEENFFAQEYLRLAQKKIEKGLDVDQEVDVEDLLKELELLKKLDKVNPYNQKFVKIGFYTGDMETVLSSKVCRGEITRNAIETKNLFCRLIANSPFSNIAPFKMEQINIDPYIVKYIGVMSDDEIAILKKLSVPQISKALVGRAIPEASRVRIAQNVWLKNSSHEVVLRISRRVEDMTGLTMETAENLQVQNYGIGGFYSAHHDFAEEYNIRERIATMMFYMSDVEKGGATIFPYLKVRIAPEKGSAAFWYNLRTSGQKDFLTLHSGCPVLLGSKWVANKWISNFGQEFIRKCLPEKFVETNEAEVDKEFL